MTAISTTYQYFNIPPVNLLLKIPTLLRLKEPRKISDRDFDSMAPLWGIRLAGSTHGL